MKLKRKPAVVFGLLLIVGVFIASFLIHPARPVSVAVTGLPGQTVKATFLIDGVTQEELLRVPTTRTVHGSDVAFWLDREPTPEYPDLHVELSLDGRSFGMAHATESDDGACGTIRTASLFRLRREVCFLAPVSREAVHKRWLPEPYRHN